MSDAKNERRRVNYAKLKEAGFTPAEATKYKDLSRRTIKEICKIKQEETNTKNELRKKANKKIEGFLNAKKKEKSKTITENKI